jgi:hypothetical protein
MTIGSLMNTWKDKKNVNDKPKGQTQNQMFRYHICLPSTKLGWN